MKVDVSVELLRLGEAARACGHKPRVTDGAHSRSFPPPLSRAELDVILPWLATLPEPKKTTAPTPRKVKTYDGWEAVLAEHGDTWRKKYPAIWPRVEEECARAWDHKSRKSYTHMSIYLANWLRRADADAIVETSRLAKAGVHTTSSSGPSQGASPSRCRHCNGVVVVDDRTCRTCDRPTDIAHHEEMSDEDRARTATMWRRLYDSLPGNADAFLKAAGAELTDKGKALVPVEVLPAEITAPVSRKVETREQKIERIKTSIANHAAAGRHDLADLARTKLKEMGS